MSTSKKDSIRIKHIMHEEVRVDQICHSVYSYLSLYVDMCPSLSQQSQYTDFPFPSCHVKSSPATLWAETHSDVESNCAP